MSTGRSFGQREPFAGRGELVGLILRIQALTLEFAELRQRGRASPLLEMKERTLDRLR